MNYENIDRNMTDENTLKLLNSIHSDLKVVKELVYNKCGFELKKFETEHRK